MDSAFKPNAIGKNGCFCYEDICLFANLTAQEWFSPMPYRLSHSEVK